MNKQELKAALSVIWALAYRATQVLHLNPDQTAKLQDALDVISKGKDNDAFFSGHATYLHDCVLTSGILSIPSRKPKGTEEIMGECERLQRHLDQGQ